MSSVLVVSVVTKIRILKQITTSSQLPDDFDCCICSNKDKNFKANHNKDTKEDAKERLYL